MKRVLLLPQEERVFQTQRSDADGKRLFLDAE